MTCFIPILLFLNMAFIHAKGEAKNRPSYYWSKFFASNSSKSIGGDRWLDCVNHGLSISRCALFEESRVSELNPGCFDELDQANLFWSYSLRFS